MYTFGYLSTVSFRLCFVSKTSRRLFVYCDMGPDGVTVCAASVCSEVVSLNGHGAPPGDELLTVRFTHRFLLHAERRRRTVACRTHLIGRRDHPARDAIRQERRNQNPSYRRRANSQEGPRRYLRYVTCAASWGAAVATSPRSSELTAFPTRPPERAAQVRPGIDRYDLKWHRAVQEASCAHTKRFDAPEH